VFGCPNRQFEVLPKLPACGRILALLLVVVLGVPAAFLTLCTAFFFFPCVAYKFVNAGGAGGWKLLVNIWTFWGCVCTHAR